MGRCISDCSVFICIYQSSIINRVKIKVIYICVLHCVRFKYLKKKRHKRIKLFIELLKIREKLFQLFIFFECRFICIWNNKKIAFYQGKRSFSMDSFQVFDPSFLLIKCHPPSNTNDESLYYSFSFFHPVNLSFVIIIPTLLTGTWATE